MNKLSEILPNTLAELGCINSSYLDEKLDMKINPNNLIDYLGVLEKRTNDISTVYDALITQGS